MLNTVLAVDIGTSSLKAGLITADGEDVFVWRQKYNFKKSEIGAGRWYECLEKALLKIQKALETGCTNILCNKNDINIVAVSVSGNGPTLVSEDGTIFRWNEVLAPKVLSDFNSGILPESARKSLFIPRILSFKEKFPEEYRNTRYLFSGPEFLIYKLTGSAVTILPEQRYSTAYWTDKTLEENGIEKGKMPPFMTIGQIFGRVNKESAEKMPLLKEGLPVYGAGPDFIAALIGTGTTEPGELCDRSGSSEGINYCVDKPIFAEGIRTLPSVKAGLWNISVLIPESSKMKVDERLEAVANGVNLLRKIAEENGQVFPEVMKVTGGQTSDYLYLKKKASRLAMKLVIAHCKHSELLGDAKVVWDNYENL